MARETGRTRPIPAMPKPALSGEAAEAAEIDAAAAAKAEKAKMEAEKNESQKDSFNPDWLRLALATGGGLIGHSLASSLFDGKTEDEKRRESLWTKLLSAMIPIGAAGLGAWGGYALGGQLKNAADNNGAQGGKTAPNQPMGTEMEIDGRLYGISPELVPIVHGMSKGWYPGMKSTELQFMQEKGPRDIDKEKWNEMVGSGAFWGSGALGGLSAFWGGKNALEGLKERRAAEAAMEAQQWADQTIRDASEISKLEGEAREAKDIARKAENDLRRPGKNLDINKTEVTKNKAWQSYSRKSKQAKPLVKTVSPTQLSTAKAVSEALAKGQAQSRIMPKPILSRRVKSLLGLGGAAAGFGAAAYAASKERAAIEQQARIRAALEQLAAQTNSAPYAASAPSR